MMGTTRAAAATSASTVKLRVLVVEDSLTIRKYLVQVLEKNDFEVVGEAGDGLTATTLCRNLRPNVVTMDMNLPGISGLAATEQIMAYCPTPILIVSASVNRGELFQTYEALAAGAVDVFDKVRADERSAGWESRFIAAVRMVARIRVITHPRARLSRARDGLFAGLPSHTGAAISHAVSRGASPGAAISSSSPDLVAIGASTGGPAAIAEILKGLAPGFPVPILIVLHISSLFAFAFAEWLNTVSPIPARYAVDGESMPRPGQSQIVLAPADRHLVAEGGVLRLVDSSERNSCKPSVDVLFESLALTTRKRVTLCLLTGMGSDGALGMLAGRQRGFETIAQDEQSSVIYGMPQAAVNLRAVSNILPLSGIAPFLNETVLGQRFSAGGAA